MYDLADKKVTILGAGRSGMATADLVSRLNGKAKISEMSPEKGAENDFKEWASSKRVQVEFGGHSRAFIEDSDLLVLSPGVRFDAYPVQWALAKRIPVIGEIEFAASFCQIPIIAVTGSNGKTTTVNLIHQVLQKGGKESCLCGNIGTPFSRYVLDLNKKDYVVLEISSFQLESIIHFRPQVAVLLNFSQNHLDRHKDIQEYFDAKKRIFLNQAPEDFAVLNYQQPMVRDLAPKLKAQVRYFNSPDVLPSMRTDHPNQQAVITVARILGISDQICYEVFRDFKGVEHRMEVVRVLNGVEYINDSKSTTAEAGRWALERLQKPVVMICGGKDKHIDFDSLRDLVQSKVKRMIVIGEAREKLKNAFGDVVPLEECRSLEEAVLRAMKGSLEGECVILSPMCASFDMFADYEDRGRQFKEIVNRLK